MGRAAGHGGAGSGWGGEADGGNGWVCQPQLPTAALWEGSHWCSEVPQQREAGAGPPPHRGGTTGPAVNAFPAHPCGRLGMTQTFSTPAAEHLRAVEEPDLIRWADRPKL